MVETRYAVAGWGVGEIWIEDGVLLAHDFHFERGPSAGSPMGVHDPPTGTVASESSRRSNGSVPRVRRSSTPPATALAGRCQAFLAGDDVEFGDVELDLDWATPLQRALAETLRGVPRGEVV